MGILNVTPDSFSDGGRYVDLDAAVDRARQMIDEGAAVIDVGGESTRPGAAPVSLDEELARVVPVIEAIAPLGTRVSVDTRHAEVATAAVDAGATLINDVSASLWPVAAELGVGWIAMHMQGEPGNMQQRPHYDDARAEIFGFLADRARLATEAGVDEVWVDPGFGFGKSVDHNLDLVAGIGELVAQGTPVMLGVSRKLTLGVLTARADHDTDGDHPGEIAPPDDRLEAGIALATWAMMDGVGMIRAHDVRPHVDAAAVVASINSPESPRPAAGN